jgi:hypothetical protein
VLAGSSPRGVRLEKAVKPLEKRFFDAPASQIVGDRAYLACLRRRKVERDNVALRAEVIGDFASEFADEIGKRKETRRLEKLLAIAPAHGDDTRSCPVQIDEALR